jgi:hypothetical protein
VYLVGAVALGAIAPAINSSSDVPIGFDTRGIGLHRR